jgi:hypothetical protein
MATTKSFRSLVKRHAKSDRKFAEALVRESVNVMPRKARSTGKCKSTKKKGGIGSPFDAFLKEEGISKQVTARAIKRVKARISVSRS